MTAQGKLFNMHWPRMKAKQMRSDWVRSSVPGQISAEGRASSSPLSDNSSAQILMAGMRCEYRCPTDNHTQPTLTANQHIHPSADRRTTAIHTKYSTQYQTPLNTINLKIECAF